MPHVPSGLVDSLQRVEHQSSRLHSLSRPVGQDHNRGQQQARQKPEGVNVTVSA